MSCCLEEKRKKKKNKEKKKETKSCPTKASAKTTSAKSSTTKSAPAKTTKTPATKTATKSTSKSADKAQKKSLYRVLYDKESRLWVIKKDGAKRNIASFPTKEEAMSRVKELSESQDLNFVVHKKDGKFQKKA